MSKDYRSPAVRAATHAFCVELLDQILPTMREAARGAGYAIAVHGSLARDIDLIAVAWTEQAIEPDELVQTLCGAVTGLLGRCHRMKGRSEKPHGRVAYTLVHGGFIGEIDISVIGPAPQPSAVEKPA